MIGPASRVVQALVAAERQIALLERVRPVGYSRQLERLVDRYQGGDETLPDFRYARSSDLSPTRRGLDDLVAHCESLGREGRWLGARARELAMEAGIVEAIGTCAIGTTAAKRFHCPALVRIGGATKLEELVEAWSSETLSEEDSALHVSCDGKDENSLRSVVERRIRELGVQAEVRVERDLVAVAAVFGNGIMIRPSELLSRQNALRIAEHEIVAHLLPRQNARRRDDILRCGCPGASDDEEGRALVIESRADLMDSGRRRELAFRHLAGSWSRQGADFVQVVRGLASRGAPLRLRLGIAMRAFRGAVFEPGGGNRLGQGGLGRELVYLPAYLRLMAAFTAAPALETWFTLGRVSLDYAEAQSEASAAGFKSTHTGT